MKTPDHYGSLIEPSSLRIERRLPGPIERVWNYLTKSKLRGEWLASGEMKPVVGTPVELVWHFDTITANPGARPDFVPPEFRIQSRVLACEAPHKLSLSWGRNENATFELKPDGDDVLLTITHRDIANRMAVTMVGASWSAQLDVLEARLAANPIEGFWDLWRSYNAGYDALIPAEI